MSEVPSIKNNYLTDTNRIADKVSFFVKYLRKSLDRLQKKKSQYYQVLHVIVF